jgi:hypothetical protein
MSKAFNGKLADSQRKWEGTDLRSSAGHWSSAGLFAKAVGGCSDEEDEADEEAKGAEQGDGPSGSDYLDEVTLVRSDHEDDQDLNCNMNAREVKAEFVMGKLKLFLTIANENVSVVCGLLSDTGFYIHHLSHSAPRSRAMIMRLQSALCR